VHPAELLDAIGTLSCPRCHRVLTYNPANDVRVASVLYEREYVCHWCKTVVEVSFVILPEEAGADE